ncbi:hypothetical protein BDN72DRAFT_850027 [Pluteus cervinus]|uniref:Uncharacterized protein n=1 Tax=Pluteus cervinus TaxID=181527 RepID=A0ACD3A5B9_9AGAR|nr:hypothetical protein BDN72DRAFT_850027 [Pluteus cervinus]
MVSGGFPSQPSPPRSSSFSSHLTRADASFWFVSPIGGIWSVTAQSGRTLVVTLADCLHIGSSPEGDRLATSSDSGAIATTSSAENSTAATASDGTETSTSTGQVFQALNGTRSRRRNRTASAAPLSSTTASSSSSNANQNNPPVANHHPFMQPSHFGINGGGLPPAGNIIIPPIPLSFAAPILGPLLRYAPPVSHKALTNDVLLDLEAKYGRVMHRINRERDFRQSIVDENRRQSLERKARMEQQREAQLDYAKKLRMMTKRVAEKRRRRRDLEQAAEVASACPPAQDDEENEPAPEVASTSSSTPSESQTEVQTGDNAEPLLQETSLVLGQDPTPEPLTSTDSSDEENGAPTAPNTTPTNEGAADSQAASAGEPSSPRGVKRAREEAEPESSQDDDEKRPTRKARPSPGPDPDSF